MQSAAHRPVYKATTITSSGTYVLAKRIVGQITIASSNVILDLNQNKITGGTHGVQINTGLANVTVQNGIILSTLGGNGVEVQANCDNIEILKMNIDQCNIGIHATTSSNISIRKCVLTRNTNEGVKLTSCSDCEIASCNSRTNKIGFFLDQTNRTHVTKTTAAGCTEHGFRLSSAQENVLDHCKALNIGATNTGDSFGFNAENGSENTFIRCVAEGITTTATAEGNVVAGFALKGTEQASSIINCVASDVQTSTSNQVIPYGIFAELTLPTPVLKQSIAWGDDTRSIRWSPNGRLLALAADPVSNRDVAMYSFDRSTETATESANALTDSNEGWCLSWSRTGERLAVSGEVDSVNPGDIVLVYDVDRVSGELTLVASDTPAGAAVDDRMHFVAWAPNDRLLLAGGMDMGGFELFLYHFDPNTNSLTLRQSIATSQPDRSAHWSPVYHTFVAVGGDLATKKVRLYEYDAVSNLTEQDAKDHGADIYSVRWSPDGLYLAAGGGTGTGGNQIRIYEFDVTAKTLTLKDSVVEGNRIEGIIWSPDGKYVLAGGNSETARIYSFSHTTKTLTLEQTLASLGDSIRGGNMGT